jgi:FKBP-type peptidyl-prolyl cis-trans isomerase FkpA
MKHLLAALLALTFFISCSKDEEVDYVAKNEQEIIDYKPKTN